MRPSTCPLRRCSAVSSEWRRRVIQANVAVINPAQVGHPTAIFVEVEVISETTELIDAKQDFAVVPEVQQCYYVTGEAEFVLVIVVPTMSALGDDDLS